MWPRALTLLTALSPLLLSSAALADGERLGCRDCGPLPEGLTIDLARCRPASPRVSGAAAKRAPEAVGVGRFFDLDTAGDGAHPARLWVGVSPTSVPYVAAFEGAATRAGWCQPIAAFEDIATWGGAVDAYRPTPALPVVQVMAFLRLGACPSVSAGATVAWLALPKTWAVLSSESSWASACEGDARPDAGPDAFALHAARYAQGQAAWKGGDARGAERHWRAALPHVEAAADLGFLLAQRGRGAEAEALLVDAARVNFSSAPWINLGDLYWAHGQKAAAALAYRQYVHVVNDPGRRREGAPAQPPAPRAVERAAPE